MIGYQYLIEIDALDNTGAPVTLYFCCKPSFTGGGGPWVPCIIDPGLMQINLFSGGKTTGASNYSYGEVILSNPKNVDTINGPRDYLKGYQFYGRPIRMSVGLMTASYPSGFTRAYTATIENAETQWDGFHLTLRGRQAELDIAINTTKFLGDNVAPDGLEGGTALKDTVKPAMLGRVYNVTPTLCNSSKMIYAVSILTGLSVSEMGSNFHVYDNGVEIYCAGVVSLTTMQSTAPPRGQYSLAVEGYIRLGFTPAGTITVTGASAGHALTSHPQVLITDLLTLTGFNSGDSKDMIDSNSFTQYVLPPARSAQEKWERGIFVNDGATISSAIDSIVAPLGYWYFNLLGTIIFGIMSDPVGRESSSVYYLQSNVNIETFSVHDTQDTTGGVPAKSVGVQYGHNYTVMDSPAGSVTPDDRALLAKPFSTAAKASTNTIYPFSEDMVVDTHLTTDTTAPLSILHDLHTVKRELITIQIVSSEFLAASALLPGQIVRVDLQGRFGYSGKPTVIVGITINYVDETVALVVWS